MRAAARAPLRRVCFADDIPRCIDSQGLGREKTWRQERVQVHDAVSGTVPKKRVISTHDFAVTDFTARSHSQRTGVVEAAGVEIDDALRASRPEQSVRLVRAIAKPSVSNLLTTAHAQGV